MVLVDDPGPSPSPFLPDWLAESPPWLQALAIVLAVVAAIALVSAASWAPAMADRIRGRRAQTPTTPDGTTSQPGQPVSAAGAPAAERYDEKMTLITKLVTGLEESQERAEEEARGLRQALADAGLREARLTAELESTRAQLAAARTEIERLRWQVGILQGGTAWTDRPPPET